MPKLWKKTGNAKNNDDLVEEDLSTLAIREPTVIYFPGRDESDGNLTALSKNLYFVQELFPKNSPRPPVYLWSHADMYSAKKLEIGTLTSLFRVAAYSHLPWLHEASPTRKLASKLIMPLVTDAKGEPLPLEEAQKNLRNLTFLAYCLGSVAAQELYNTSMKMIQKAGYSEEDARKLLREIVLISFATFTRPEKEQDRYTTLDFVNSDDQFLRAKNMVVFPLSSTIAMGESFFKSSRKLEVTALSNSSTLISAAARERPLRSLFRKKQKEVIEGVQLPRWRLIFKDSKGNFGVDYNHSPEDYGLGANTKTNQLAGIVQHALIKAVNRKGPVNPGDLLDRPASQKKPGIVDTLFHSASKLTWKRLLFLQ